MKNYIHEYDKLIISTFFCVAKKTKPPKDKSNAKTLDDLPPELLEKIFESLWNVNAASPQREKRYFQDLLQLSLVCKKFRALVRGMINAEVITIPEFARKNWFIPPCDHPGVKVVIDPDVSSFLFFPEIPVG